MSEFFVRLAEGRDTSQLDAALDAAKVGTNFQSDRLRTVRDSLDRKRFLRFFVAEMAGVSSTTQSDARSIATEAARRGSLGAVAQLLALWPRDSLQILRAMPGGPPVPFEELTEGLRALAIKEISFAASNLPVISDQPEDAVPTAAVFGTLVPTLRTQRRKRQFILASHDANVVVAGDVDRVVVLPGEPEGEQLAGTLFEGAVRTSAMDLLEGGAVAFERRRRRYGAV